MPSTMDWQANNQEIHYNYAQGFKRHKGHLQNNK